MQQSPSKPAPRMTSRIRLPRKSQTTTVQASDSVDGQTGALVAQSPHTYMLFHLLSKMYIPWPHGRLKLRDRKKINILLTLSNTLYGGTCFVPVVICHRYDTNGVMDAEVITNAVDI